MKKENCIKIKLDMSKIKDIITLDDYFIITGLSPYLKDRTLTDVKQIFINELTGEKIYDCWKKNWKKNKELKCYKKSYAMSKLAFNWFNYAPCYSKDIPEGYIYLYTSLEK